MVSLNILHRTQAVQIQRVARGLLGRRFVLNVRRVGAAKIIQHHIRLFLLRARARGEVSRRRALKIRREVAAVTLQRMGRGLIVRTGWRRQIRGDILRWFIRKVRSTIRIALAVQTLRSGLTLSVFEKIMSIIGVHIIFQNEKTTAFASYKSSHCYTVSSSRCSWSQVDEEKSAAIDTGESCSSQGRFAIRKN